MANLDLSALNIINAKEIFHNLTVPLLVEEALKNGEGTLSPAGAFVVNTGKYTGRSPNDKFIVDEPSIHDEIAWGSVNAPMCPTVFDKLYRRITAYIQNRKLYVLDGLAGADPAYQTKIRVVNEFAHQNLFMRQLLLRPEAEQLVDFAPDFTIVCAPGFKCIPELDGTKSEAAIVISFEKKVIMVAGSAYSGEMKKSVFSLMNYLMPKRGAFPMHCSANEGADGDVALFFGLSGTGKTTLSADPNRMLIGDDEHVWTDDGVFNIEGGCYAKCIDLSQEHEPEIWNAIKFGALVENVVFDPQTREFDFADDSLTENTRVGYPVDFIPNCKIPGIGAIPKTVIFLTADAFGVLPPVSKLNADQAMFHFVSGYTARLAGTERGVTEPQATFSTCFGAPFLPLDPSVYAELLGKYVDKYGSNVYLINTGWSGGSAGNGGNRMKLPLTRAMVTAALNGDLENGKWIEDPIFNVSVPASCPNVPDEVLQPRMMWEDKAAYDATAKQLAAMFRKNFEQYTHMPKNIVDAGPQG